MSSAAVVDDSVLRHAEDDAVELDVVGDEHEDAAARPGARRCETHGGAGKVAQGQESRYDEGGWCPVASCGPGPTSSVAVDLRVEPHAGPGEEVALRPDPAASRGRRRPDARRPASSSRARIEQWPWDAARPGTGRFSWRAKTLPVPPGRIASAVSVCHQPSDACAIVPSPPAQEDDVAALRNGLARVGASHRPAPGSLSDRHDLDPSASRKRIASGDVGLGGLDARRRGCR